MKILFSLTYYSPYVSGLSIYVKRLAERLVINGYECEVMCFKHNRELPESEKTDGVTINRVNPWVSFSKGFLSGEWVTQGWKLVSRSDVIIINLPEAEGWITALIAKILSKKIITIYHCEIVLPNKLVQMALEWANRISLHLSDKVVTYTQDYADNSKLLKPYRRKLEFVYPPIIKPEVSKKVNNKKYIVIGVAARLAEEKGLEYLFEAIPKLKSALGEIEIKIAGPMSPVGESEYKDKIFKIVDKYKDTIDFLGTIPEEQMGNFYKGLDVLVLPSINSTESFGMVQVEAMMMGIPVVASDLPGVRIPITRTGMGIVVPVKNSNAIVEAIEKIINHKQMYIKKTTVIEKEFDVEKTIEFYKILIK